MLALQIGTLASILGLFSTPAHASPLPEIATNTPVAGQWSLCTKGSGRFFGMLQKPIASQRTTYSFDDSKVTVTISSFAAKGCEGQSLFDYQASGSYDVGAANSHLPKATGIVPRFDQTAQITVHDEQTAQFFTFQQLCKIAKWTPNEAVTSNTACDAKFYNELAEADVFQIIGTKLYFGRATRAPAGLITNFAYASNAMTK